MHEVLVNRLGGLSLPRKSVVRLTDRPDMTLDVYRGRKTTMQQQQQLCYKSIFLSCAVCGNGIFTVYGERIFKTDGCITLTRVHQYDSILLFHAFAGNRQNYRPRC